MCPDCLLKRASAVLLSFFLHISAPIIFLILRYLARHPPLLLAFVIFSFPPFAFVRWSRPLAQRSLSAARTAPSLRAAPGCLAAGRGDDIHFFVDQGKSGIGHHTKLALLVEQ